MASLDFQNENRVFREWYARKYPTLRAAEKTFRNLIQLLLSDVDEMPQPKVVSRLKDRDECIAKFQRKYQTYLEKAEIDYEIQPHVTDLIGIRVICLYESNVPQVVSILKQNFKLLDETDKTAELVSEDDKFGYKGQHLDLKLNLDRTGLLEYRNFFDLQFEVQVRTIVQDAWSEIDHKLKYKKDLPSALKRRVFILAGLFELADREFDDIRKETQKLVTAELEKDSSGQAIEQPLDPFNFLRLMRAYFPNYNFHEDKVEGFIEDIRACNPSVTINDLEQAMQINFDRIEEYRNWCLENLGKNLNPYTEIRHIMYRFKASIYDDLMFFSAKNRFSKWDIDGTIFNNKDYTGAS